ncbi:MAG: integrase [Candidatus Saccharibacteria bacterium]
MDTTHIPTLIQMADYVSGSSAVNLHCQDRKEAYNYVERVAVKHSYLKLNRRDKGIIRGYLEATTGYSGSQLTRLLKQYRNKGHIIVAKRTQPTFKGTYTAADVTELARIDDLLDGLSGPATCRVLKREYIIFGNETCERLQYLSVAQLYRFRQSSTYRRVRTHYTKTKSSSVSIGERTKPNNNGQPGYLRVDSVHQGDKDGEKGVYHINLVDEVTQWEVVVCVQGISEQFMIPALTAAMDLFPFMMINFHADNGSEYINQKVAALLQRMLVKLTKSRPYHSGDNGLAETKNGSIIRKTLGWIHIPRTPDNVMAINHWYAIWFVPYLNFHRACAFRTTTIDEKGKRKHCYPNNGYLMPYEKLKSLPNAKQYLKPGITFELLDEQAYAMSDTQWATAMQDNKAAMWESIRF